MKLTRKELTHAQDTQLAALGLARTNHPGWLKRALATEFDVGTVEAFHQARRPTKKERPANVPQRAQVDEMDTTESLENDATGRLIRSIFDSKTLCEHCSFTQDSHPIIHCPGFESSQLCKRCGETKWTHYVSLGGHPFTKTMIIPASPPPAQVLDQQKEIDRMKGELREANACLAVLTSERNSFIDFVNTLPHEGRPVLVGPIQIARWHIDRLRAELARVVSILERIEGNDPESNRVGADVLANKALAPFRTAKPNPDCGCRACNPKAWWMVCCSTCGNKRCPHATNHEHACFRPSAGATGSGVWFICRNSPCRIPCQ